MKKILEEFAKTDKHVSQAPEGNIFRNLVQNETFYLIVFLTSQGFR